MTADAVGGVWNYSLNLARNVAPHGIEIHLAVMGPAPSRDQKNQAQDLPIHESSFALEWMADPWRDVEAAGDWLLALERQLSPDLIHLNGYSHGALPFRGPKLVVAHSCVCSWWRAVHGEAAPHSWDEYRHRVRAGLLSAHTVVAVSSAMSDGLKAEYARPADQIIYNGTVLGMRHRPKAPAVFCAGRFGDEAKNLRAIEEAAGLIDAEIFAAGAERESDRIWSLGILSQPEMQGWYEECAVFCHPALYEPFGLAPLEAAAAGCALVLGDIPSLREIWQDCAIFVDPRVPEKLARSINELLGNPELLEKMSLAARRRAAVFSGSRQASEYAALYRSLLGSGHERASFRP